MNTILLKDNHTFVIPVRLIADVLQECILE